MASRMVPDDFEFERTLGIGAFSKVLAARYLPDGKKYAVKVIAKRQILNAGTEEERQRLVEVARREMRMLLMCEHPNIIRFSASMQTNEDLMYVTELCDGGELLDAIKRRGTIPIAAAKHAIAEVLSAVCYLHHGEKRSWPIVANAPLKAITIFHRDLKPENLMLTSTKHVKLIDFGTAVIVENALDHAPDERSQDKNGGNGGRGRAQTFCGTTHYMSPELLQDSYTCLSSDYWSAGCVLFHMITGKKPFDAPTQYLLIKSILEDDVQYPDSFDSQAKDLCKGLMTRDPTKRLGSTETGGFDAIKSHPFFSGINWDTLATDDVSKLWRRDAVWVKDNSVSNCKQCNREFGVFRRKHHCRNCGNIFCNDCSSRQCIIPESTYTAQERVCDSCFGRLHQN